MEQGRNGTAVKHHCRRTLNLNFGELIKTRNLFFVVSGLLLLPNTWKCTMLKRKSEMVKVCLTSKWNQMKTCKSLFYWNSNMTCLPSTSRNHLPPTGPPRVCVLSRHLCVSPTPGGPLLGQTLPAAPWGPGADCQESGRLERRGGQTCFQSHTVLSHKTHILVIQDSGFLRMTLWSAW